VENKIENQINLRAEKGDLRFSDSSAQRRFQELLCFARVWNKCEGGSLLKWERTNGLG
jgi:hypothetical protein